ncbi:MAG: hypothetical protein R6X03_02545, partial [Methyloceanibacter sp.]
DEDHHRRHLSRNPHLMIGGSGFRLIVLHARTGAEAFYAAHGYLAEGDPFEENTLPHVTMSKRLGQPKE